VNTRIKIDRQKLLRLLDGHPVQFATSVGLLELEHEQTRWRPMRRVAANSAIRQAHRVIGIDPDDLEVWTNGEYEAFLKPLPRDGQPGSRDGMVHLSIKRMDRMPVHNWRHLQQIKNEVVGELREAVELYPSEHRIADTANQTHLWVFPEGEIVPVGFEAGFALTDEQVEQMNANSNKARQEPQQPGLTTGDGMRAHIAQGETDPDAQEIVHSIVSGRAFQ
jgi:hypothetical protein